MNSLVLLAHSVSPTAAGLLIASVWQGIVLTAGVGVVLALLRSISPAARTWIWTSVLLLVLVLPVLALLLPHAAVAGHAELHVASDWSVGLLAVWATLSLLRAVQLTTNGFRLWRLAGRATPITVDGQIGALLEGSRRAQLCVSAEVDRPSVAGFFRPRVLLPEGLIETLSAAELAHVVLHEMEHLRRYDDWLNLLQQVSLVLLPLNPALVWLDRRLCHERELACDDGVLAATQARKAYAACLVKLAEDSLLRKGVALALSALGTKARQSELVGRVRRILASPEAGAGNRRAPVAVGAVAFVALAGTAVLARSPQWVSFDGVDAPAAQASMAVPSMSSAGVVNGGPRMLPVAAMETESASRPVYAKAVMTQRPAVRRATGPEAGHKKPRVRPAPMRVIAGTVPVSGPDVRRDPMPAGRMVMTEFEVSQPVYAAVPWQGGWLIVQL